MSVKYDEYYQTENLFGEPYPELLNFFSGYPARGKLLDLGCGQGRNSIALAKLGYKVTGIDNSNVGIQQMNQIAKLENIQLIGRVENMYEFAGFEQFDFLLFDSIFHFMKADFVKETGFVKRVINESKKGALLVFCIQNTGTKVKTLKEVIDSRRKLACIADINFQYTFMDSKSGHKLITNYQLVAVEK